ncbi:hypothetical protein [Burkholderia vietnamiensis]|uniref:hypothetical protein n=1 Tax=Burkholderia vietnamiensis TaxID=60552 RepID=UPI000B1DEA02|nr:hypothetical protein [Burkholderia vietnamiensis]MBR8204985.1 hypothetical protein [Burkholderia vietnamiensis]MCA8392881.1 hypothetical protein [Burkholderia vietnamiensis]HDR8958357.1 hypothetical protein [Burkholderia vietnamiensis]HDR9245777.1 hypothetical protein [Burkholderia vietnamiensis]
MTKKKIFHVVCEGNTDYEVLRAVAKEVGLKQGEDFRTSPLFPPNPKANAGWPNLKIWCKKQASTLSGTLQAEAVAAATLLGATPMKNAEKRQVDKISAALLLKSSMGRNAIVLQLDADIAHDLFPDAGVPKDTHLMPLTPADRVRICEAAIDSWLGPHLKKKNIDIYYCITSLALENWILTLHNEASLKVPVGENYDHLHYPDQRLVALGYANSKGELKKDPPKYKLYGEALAKGLQVSIYRSPSLFNYCSTLSSA